MRETKFRGKRKDNGNWVVGNYVSTSHDEAFILLGITAHIKRNDYECYMVEVLPETVGEWTGLKDRNGKEIYENDIIKSYNFEGEAFLSLVLWNEQYARFEGTSRLNEKTFLPGYGYRPADLFYIFEIIGNIHDNPELINAAGERYLATPI